MRGLSFLAEAMFREPLRLFGGAWLNGRSHRSRSHFFAVRRETEFDAPIVRRDVGAGVQSDT